MLADQQRKSRPKSILREIVETIVLTLLIYFLVRTFLFENYRVVGHSMLPTLQEEQFLVVSKLTYRLREPERGDIIVFHHPQGGDRKLIKRVIALPGEEVEISKGQVYIDGQRLDESYLDTLGRTSRPPSLIAEGEYFVMGDNRNNSSDSRSWGTLSRDSIVGMSLVSYWPPNLWGIVPHADYGDAQ
jgi:signal peptidase I